MQKLYFNKKQKIRINCKLLMMTDCACSCRPYLLQNSFFLSAFITENRIKIVNIITNRYQGNLEDYWDMKNLHSTEV